MMHYFIVAFGHGKDALLTAPLQQATAALRSLLDAACSATFGRFPDDVLTSVAPGGVMLAFPDGNPAREEQLCEAVVSQLAHAQATQATVLPICAVITHGPMRSVDVLGYHTNFEGRPAIAAARILAELSSGWLAVGKSAWQFTALAQHLGEDQRLPGKHEGEAFSVRLHQRVRFPTPTSALPVLSSSTSIAHNSFVWRAGIRNAADFFNREREQRTLRVYLHGRQHCQIVGPRRMGKTSLLLHLERIVPTWKPAAVVTYLDLQDARCFTLRVWLAQASQRFGTSASPTTLAEFAECIEDMLRAGRHPVLCLDEFEELTLRREEFTRDFFVTLRSCGQRGMSIVTAAQQRLSNLTESGDPTSPFYNTFPLVPLGPFDDTEAHYFVALAREGVAPFTPAERQVILAFANGHPLALQVTCFHVLQGREEGLNLSDALLRAEDDMQAHLPTWQAKL